MPPSLYAPHLFASITARYIKMAKKGRELERITALVEKCLTPPDAEVESPAFIPDRVTGSLREVDIAIRCHLGSVPVLIIIECRDHRVAQDVTWIEQVAQKRNDLNAARAVAVSASGFSEAARTKARFEGIELREVGEITLEDVSGWFAAGELTSFRRKSLLHHISVRLDGSSVTETPAIPDDWKPRFARLDLNDCLFVAKTGGKSASIAMIWGGAVAESSLFDGVPQDGSRVMRHVELMYDDSDRFQLSLPSEPVDVLSILVQAELWVERVSVPISRLYGYVDDSGSLVQTVEYEVESAEHTRVISFHRPAGSEVVGVSVRQRPRDDRR